MLDGMLVIEGDNGLGTNGHSSSARMARSLSYAGPVVWHRDLRASAAVVQRNRSLSSVLASRANSAHRKILRMV